MGLGDSLVIRLIIIAVPSCRADVWAMDFGSEWYHILVHHAAKDCVATHYMKSAGIPTNCTSILDRVAYRVHKPPPIAPVSLDKPRIDLYSYIYSPCP